MVKPDDIFRVQNYYPLTAHCMLTASFAALCPDEIQALVNGDVSGTAVNSAVRRIAEAMQKFRGKCFLTTDFAAPTDSPRYCSNKRGSAASAASAWYSLVSSKKIKQYAAEGLVSTICVRKFKVFDIPREFRLFIKDGELCAMSQRFLIRHFRRLVGRKQTYWEMAQEFTKQLMATFPIKTAAPDIYITSAGKVVLIDLNPWGGDTDPLMLNSWDRDFSKPLGCVLVPPPHVLSGDVNVSF